MNLSPQQQQYVNSELSKERDKVTVSWNNELREWHPLALQALQYATVASLQVPQRMYRRLLHNDQHGVNLNVVGILCNNMEHVTPQQMGVTPVQWADIIELNATIATTWNAHNEPILKQVLKRLQILNGAAPVVKMGEA